MTVSRTAPSTLSRPVQGHSRVAELLLAALGCVLATVVGNWQTVRTLTTSVSGDLGDPMYFTWQLAWVSHALREDPLSFTGPMWTTNAFQQAPDSLAYTDVVLGYAPLGMALGEGPKAALAQLNLSLLVAAALAAFAGYVLLRVVGSGIPGAALGAAAMGFAPWRDTQVIHINVLSTGGIILAVALLLYGHAWSMRHGWRPERMRPRWIVAGWLVASYQMLFGFALGIWFAYTLAAIGALLVIGWLVRGRHRAPIPRAVVWADLGGGLAYLLTVGALLIPHFWVLARTPESQRSVAMLDLFSPPWYGLLTGGTWNAFWGTRQSEWRGEISQRWPPEMFMSPGIILIVLAVAGLFVSVWTRRRRLLLAGATLALAVVALGTRGPDGGRLTYLPLYEYLPGWDQIRTPGRLVIWVTIGLAVLAAGFVSALAERWLAGGEGGARGLGGASGTEPKAPVLVALALLLPTALVYAEGWDRVPRWNASLSPVELSTLEQPILILPTGLVADYHLMFWSTDGWPVLTNGDSSFDSAGQAAMRKEAATFPDAASVAALRERGVETVMVVRSRTGPGSWEGAADAPVEGLGITRTDTGDAVLFDLRP